MKLKLILLLVAQILALVCVHGQTVQPLDTKIAAIINRPEFRHALFGIEIYSLSDSKVLYALNEHKLFVPGSVTKLVTEGVAMELLGADYRFRTPIYRTGPISNDGVLRGDLVLVASGDPNLSNRVNSPNTLAFQNEDHAYGQILEAKLVPGDPLQVIRALAKQVAAKGVKRIEGRILVDVSLFPEGTREGGSGVVISPVSVNDNVIDVIVTPGKSPGSPASLQTAPVTKSAKQKNFRHYYDALPILGKDGTLWDIQRDSPAAGRLRAKTGTHVTGDLLNEQYVVNGKGLAGYLETKNGKQLIVAIFANHVPAGGDMKAVFKVGDALAEIAAAAYDSQ